MTDWDGTLTDTSPDSTATKVKTWRTIESAPTDDRKFLIGKYDGEQLWNEDYTDFVWAGEPQWIQAISHHENPRGPHLTRGWNHRNGPIYRPTHWKELDDGPAIDNPVVIVEQETS